MRLRIVAILSAEELSVGALVSRIGMSQSALSQHLSRLRRLDLVTTRREAQTIYYKCENPGVHVLLESLADLEYPADSRTGYLVTSNLAVNNAAPVPNMM